jgi:hypothetical protein
LYTYIFLFVVKEELLQLKMGLDVMRVEKKRADDRADAAVRDKNLILRLRSGEIASLKQRVAELEDKARAGSGPEMIPVELPTIDSIAALSERFRRTDAASVKAMHASIATMLNHPMMPELVSQLGLIISK